MTSNILDQVLTAPEAEQLWGLSVGTGGLWPCDYCLPQICRHVAGHPPNDGSTLCKASR
jgi:hypothetical protein